MKESPWGGNYVRWPSTRVFLDDIEMHLPVLAQVRVVSLLLRHYYHMVDDPLIAEFIIKHSVHIAANMVQKD